MLTLTTPIALANGTRLDVDVTFSERDDLAVVEVRLLSPPASGLLYHESTGFIRNGVCDRWSRVTPEPGMRPNQLIRHERSVLTKPTGFADLFAAWRAGGTKAARQSAAEQHLIANGYFVNLAGS